MSFLKLKLKLRMTHLIPSGMSDKGPRLEGQAPPAEASPQKPSLCTYHPTAGHLADGRWASARPPLCGPQVTPLFSRRAFFPRQALH